MTILYKASATATGGRDGRSVSSDGILDVKLAYPKEMGGTGGATNPEQLFAAGYAACYLNALKHVASQGKLAFPKDANVRAEVGIGPNPAGAGFALDIDLFISLPGLERDVAQQLVETGHQVCPYSNATRNNVRVGLHLVD